MSDQPHYHGFEFVLPMPQRQESNRQRFQDEMNAAEALLLLDDLTAKQLVKLRLYLRADKQTRNWIEGQIWTLLSKVHGCDPITGLTLAEQLGTPDDAL